MKPIEKKLDELVRQIVMKRDCPTGFGKCFICGKPGHVKQMEVGYFVVRSNHTVKWDLDNLHMICYYCNRFDNDHFSNYRYRMIQVYGEDFVKDLIFKGKQLLKAFEWELEELYEELKKQL
jgi:5-methylcytosine-specific restriction endonuclease McrA